MRSKELMVRAFSVAVWAMTAIACADIVAKAAVKVARIAYGG